MTSVPGRSETDARPLLTGRCLRSMIVLLNCGGVELGKKLEKQHEANFVLDCLPGTVGVRYRLRVAAL
jgi:hypothetical protein